MTTSPSDHGKIAPVGTKGDCLPVESPFSALEFESMTYGNGVRDDSQQLRDIQDLIARLKDVNQKLALPIRTLPTGPATQAVADPAEAATA